MLDLNEAERLEAKNRSRLATVVIVLTCMVLLAGQIPSRPDGPQRRALFGFGLKDKDCSPVCINGGACDPNTGKCVCPSGFSGSGCETANVEECDPPCTGNSFCNENLVCECLNGFIPPDCVEDFCSNVVCQNGGTCINEAAGFKCDCLDDYAGTVCELDKAETKVIFVTSQVWQGNLGGLLGADDKCQRTADAAKLDGTYKAWLSAGAVNAKDRLTQNPYAYVLPRNGATVANSFDDLVNVNLDHDIDRNAWGIWVKCPGSYPDVVTCEGNSRGGSKCFCSTCEVWTGTDEHGVQHDGDCTEWTEQTWSTDEDDDHLGLVGNIHNEDDDWTDHDERGCNGYKRLYCIQQ